ncbi:MAG: recombinase family protein [Sphingobacteriaceae bacterium]|nr:recombinase family protein [Sphingobacteriaceae bacterium]
MKTAILYLRVSTDEQPLRGLFIESSAGNANYCKLHGISILKIFTEDHSAKSFRRPKWMKLTIYFRCKKHIAPEARRGTHYKGLA